MNQRITPVNGVGAATSEATVPILSGFTCHLCGSQLKWKLSGRGRHYGGRCETHGFVDIVRHPLYNPRPRRKGAIERFTEWLLGV